MGRPGVAAARDQVARVIRDGDADEALSPRAEGVVRPSDDSRPAAPAPAEPRVAAQGVPSAPDAAEEKSGGGRRKILLGVAALVLLAGAAYGTNYFIVGRYRVTTDDAYVRANNTT